MLVAPKPSSKNKIRAAFTIISDLLNRGAGVFLRVSFLKLSLVFDD